MTHHHHSGVRDEHCHPAEQILRKNLQFFDLKQMIEFETRYRTETRAAIRALKNWRRAYEAETDMVALLYGTIEGVMLRRRAEDFTRLYWLLRADVRQAVALYVGRTQGAQPWRNVA